MSTNKKNWRQELELKKNVPTKHTTNRRNKKKLHHTHSQTNTKPAKHTHTHTKQNKTETKTKQYPCSPFPPTRMIIQFLEGMPGPYWRKLDYRAPPVVSQRNRCHSRTHALTHILPHPTTSLPSPTTHDISFLH